MKRISEEIVKHRCEELGLVFENLYVENKESWVDYTCEKHKEKGVQSIRWYHLKSCSKGCPYCTGRYKSTDDFIAEVSNIHPNIFIIGEYFGSEKPIRCKCKIDGTVWSPIARSLKQGQGCPTCGIKSKSEERTKDHDTYIAELNSKYPHIEVISRYIKQKIPIRCRCRIHGVEWESYPANLLNGSAGCPSCACERTHDKFKLDKEVFIRRVHDACPTTIVLGEYWNFFTKLKCKCSIHNKVFYQTPHGMLGGKNGCPLCVRSKGEEKLHTLLYGYSIEIVTQYSFEDCRNISKLKFDAYAPKHNILFEYNGEQHYFPVDFAGYGSEWAENQFRKNLKRDIIKKDYCKKHNITLIVIPYWEYDNMDEFLHNKLKEALPHKALSPHKVAN